MNVLNETRTERETRRQLIFRLEQELDNACKEVQKDVVYSMYKGESRTIMTFDFWVNWMPQDDLKIVIKQVRELNNNNKF